MSGKDYKFLYWDDYEESEEDAEKRINISDKNYNIYDDEEEEDVE